VQDAFFSLNVTPQQHAYYGHGNPSADELVSLPTATQAGFDEALVLSRRGSLAQPAGGVGTVADLGANSAWPSPPGAASRRQSVDESAFAPAYAFEYAQQHAAPAPAQGQFALAAAPSPGTQRSASASSDGAPADAMAAYAFPGSAYVMPEFGADASAFALLPADLSAYTYPTFDAPGYHLAADYGAPSTVLT
jgi:hypothetical protein